MQCMMLAGRKRESRYVGSSTTCKRGHRNSERASSANHAHVHFANVQAGGVRGGARLGAGRRWPRGCARSASWDVPRATSSPGTTAGRPRATPHLQRKRCGVRQRLALKDWEGATGRARLGGRHWEGATGRAPLGGRHWEGATGRAYGRAPLGGRHWEGATGRAPLGGALWGSLFFFPAFFRTINQAVRPKLKVEGSVLAVHVQIGERTRPEVPRVGTRPITALARLV